MNLSTQTLASSVWDRLPVRGRGLSRRSSGGSWRGEKATVNRLVDSALIWLEDILGPPKASAPVKNNRWIAMDGLGQKALLRISSTWAATSLPYDDNSVPGALFAVR